MKRLVVTALVLLCAGMAYAASVHLKGGKNAEVSFVDGGLVLSASSELAGLGNEDVFITLDALADVTSTCTNKGGNMAPGQNPAEVSVTGGVSIPAEEIKNGNLAFDVTTVAPVTPIPGAPGCPNKNWVQDITDMMFTSGTVTVEQGGEVVLVVHCHIDPPTSDGVVDADDVSCD